MKASASLDHGFSLDATNDVCQVRQATAADAPAIGALFRKCFGFEQPPMYFASKYFQASVGTSVSMIAEADGQVIGHYGLWGVPIRLGFELVAGAQSVDTMTHPDYRGRGVLVRLATRGMDIAAQRGIDVLYGFPNGSSFPASIRRLNWHHIADVPMFSRPLRPEGLRRVPRSLHAPTTIALKIWPRVATSAYDILLARPDDGALARLLTHRSADDGICQTERFPQWYDWRFSRALGREYQWGTIARDGRPAAFAVWRHDRAERSAAIAELIGEDDGARAAMVATVMNHAAAEGCAAVDTMTTRPDIQRALRANGFRRNGRMHLKVRSLTGRVLGANIHEGENWRLLGADCDVY